MDNVLSAAYRIDFRLGHETAEARRGKCAAQEVCHYESRADYCDVPVRASSRHRTKPPMDAQNALTQAAARGDMHQLQAVLRDYPDVEVNGRNKYGRTALQVMTMTRPEVAEFLLRRGADPNEPDIDVGRTPLHDAAEQGHENTVALLLEYGADPRHRERIAGNIPAHLAAAEARPDRILELLSRGSTLWERNAAGRTPHEEATANGRRETAEWIEDYHRSGMGTSLAHLCRLAIHCALGTRRMRRVRELGGFPLPESLVDYLAMRR